MVVVCKAGGERIKGQTSGMKLRPRFYFVLSGVLIVVFVVLLYLKIEFMTYGFLGASIGALIRGFYEEKKEIKKLKDNSQ